MVFSGSFKVGVREGRDFSIKLSKKPNESESFLLQGLACQNFDLVTANPPCLACQVDLAAGFGERFRLELSQTLN